MVIIFVFTLKLYSFCYKVQGFRVFVEAAISLNSLCWVKASLNSENNVTVDLNRQKLHRKRERETSMVVTTVTSTVIFTPGVTVTMNFLSITCKINQEQH